MEYMEGKGTARAINGYIEGEMPEFRTTAEKELDWGIAPEAKEAFARKPYYNLMGMKLKSRPVLR